MKYSPGCLELIDQRQLPTQEIWVRATTLEEVAIAIETMVVRGAPAIGCAAGWGLALDAHLNHVNGTANDLWNAYKTRFLKNVDRLARTRPTAVNLFYALKRFQSLGEEIPNDTSMSKVAQRFLDLAQFLDDDDVRTCKSIGEHGASIFKSPVSGLTHCNTGSLATAGYGTALGIIRSMHSQKKLKSIFVDETRPYFQGARLTAFELLKDNIPYTLISDNMAGYAMQKGLVDFVVIGADRIANNGDTANKIGSYSLAVLCKYHQIPFIVAAPMSTVDIETLDGSKIPVEERPRVELLEVNGYRVAPSESKVWNPSFDVTPASLISYIVTEKGVHKPPFNFSQMRF
ncbi:MAG: S-methyl-5-thioribose-1-phosphate isomerase [Proteobacteria bacterium]|nr:S-methyl-5-thioribose-1-phosphate isomerase [Pseudomonadota bacterium]